MDLHAHAGKRGIFLFGNYNEFSLCLESFLYAKLLQINCVNFDLAECNFTEYNMYSRDKADNTTKAGSSRVGLYKKHGFPNIYTLEANYNAGKIVNKIPPSGLTETKHADPSTYTGAPTYDIDIFHDCGKAIGVSILDLAEKNSDSRLANCPLKDLNGVREEA